MSEGFSEFLKFFLDEAQDALDVWEKACFEIERSNTLEAREDLYRSAHNLKSGSGAVGLNDFNELVHHVEDLIAKILAEKVAISPSVIKVLLDAHSLLNTWINRLKAGSAYHPQLEIKEIYQCLERVGTDAPPSPRDDQGNEAAHLLLQSLSPALSAPAAELAPGPTVQDLSPPLEKPQGKEKEKEREIGPKSQESIRVAATKLDHLVQLVGELSTQQAIVWHARQNNLLQSKSSDNAIQLIQKISKELQTLALSLRLQTLQSLFQRLERTGRDLARSQEKKIDVRIQGDYVEADRTVIERIADALNHVIRNAIDHGIETPAERLQSSKTEAATLRIEAVQETNGVMITVSDDGRGLNTDKILKKAVERGIVRPDAHLAPRDIHRLIFHAGLSTADKITDVSGRGVGMDVVKNSVEAIGGSIHVTSQAQQGTRFALTLPATLSIVDALIVVVDGSRYAIPVQDVGEIIDALQSNIKTVAGFGRLLTLREMLIPVESLREHLPKRPLSASKGRSISSTRSHSDQQSSTSLPPALIVRSGLESLAFEVDAILGQQPVTVRRLPHIIAHIAGYTGGTILGDGDPCLVLNLPALVSRHFDSVNRSRHHQGEERESEIAVKQSDQVNAIESRFLIFESHGHEFGVPLLRIREILRDLPCEPMVGAASHLLGCINIRGLLIAVYDPGVILGLPLSDKNPSTDIVLDDGDGSFAIRVQRVCSVANIQALESHILEKHQDIIPGFHGYLGTGTYQGRPIALLDLQETVRSWELQRRSPAHSSSIKQVENKLEVS